MCLKTKIENQDHQIGREMILNVAINIVLQACIIHPVYRLLKSFVWFVIDYIKDQSSGSFAQSEQIAIVISSPLCLNVHGDVSSSLRWTLQLKHSVLVFVVWIDSEHIHRLSRWIEEYSFLRSLLVICKRYCQRRSYNVE